MNKLVLNALVAVWLLAGLLPFAGAQSRLPKGAPSGQAELVSKFKKNTLMDISPDGSLLLLYGASTPKKELKAGVIEWKPKRGEEYFDLLRVVEWTSGRELAAIHVHAVPNTARFTHDGKQVCYGSAKETKLWDYVSGHTGNCSVDDEQGAYRGYGQKYDSPDGKFVAETTKENVRQVWFLTYVRGVVNVVDRNTGEKLVTVAHATVREPYDWPLTGYVYSVGFTPDNQHLVTSYESDTYVWRLKP